MREEIKPQIGAGATLQIGSDSYPYSIIKISPSGKTITLQADHYKRVDNNGLSESQIYEYTPNPEGETITARQSRKDGSWRSQKRPVSLSGRRAYLDPSF